MFKIIILFIILIVGMILGPILASHQGLVFFQMSGYRIQMSLTTFVFIELFVLLILFVIYSILSKLCQSKSSLGLWISSLSFKKSAKKLEQAQWALLEGESKKAAILLAKSANASPKNILLHLQTAQEAINSEQFHLAKDHLDQAAKLCQKNEKFTFKLIQLRLLIKTEQNVNAKIAIEKMLDENPRHGQLLRLANEFYEQTYDYQGIIDILPSMYKSQVFQESKLDLIKESSYTKRIRQLAEKETTEELLNWWNNQPRAIRKNETYQSLIKQFS